jgi:hypothetical protein
MKNWKPSITDDAKPLGALDFKDQYGEWNNFEVVELPDRLVFGTVCNTGFLESGYMLFEDGESAESAFQELLSDLETYYADGPDHVSRIVCNDRM